MIYADLKGIRYLHTPLRALDHTPEGFDAKEWAQRWENRLNYSDCQPIHHDAVLTCVPKAHHLRPRSGPIYSVKHCHKITNHLPLQWDALRARLRAGYHPESGPEMNDNPFIAVHIRRGDVSSEGNNQLRYTPLESVIARTELALNHLAKLGRSPQVRVYSQGAIEDFAELAKRFDAELHLEEDEFSTFHALVSAEALVMAKSSFSYLAALISTGICIYEPFWHPPMPDWINIHK